MKTLLAVPPFEAQETLPFESTGREFFRNVLNLDWDSTVLTDGSSLDEFALSNVPRDLSENDETAALLYKAWNSWTVPTICGMYSLEPFSPSIELSDLFRKIYHRKLSPLH